MKDIVAKSRRAFLAALAATVIAGCGPSDKPAAGGGGDIIVGEFASLTGS